LQKVAGLRAHVGDVQLEIIREFGLHSQVELINRGDLAFKGESVKP